MGASNHQTAMFHYTSVDPLVPADDPLRAIESVIDREVIRERMAPFHSPLARPSVPPEQLLKAMLIGHLFGITSERRLMREIQVNLSYRRFPGLDLESEVGHATTFTKNRNQRFKESEIFRWLFDPVVAGAVTKGLVTGHHVSQDGTLVRANRSFKSIEPITVAQSPKQYREHVAKGNPDTAEPAPTEAPADRTGPPTAGASDGGPNPSQREAGTMKPSQQNRNECPPRGAHPAGAVRPRPIVVEVVKVMRFGPFSAAC